jgi:TonB family protein
MPSTAKDSLFEATSAEGTAKSEIQGSQPSDAIGAEVPVTIHASRYSAASKGAGKLPPVHEETRTVIIFPQGAVVRLSAMVTPGELVVVTNNRTGADVICRVTSVKTQPGIQNYVNLEFTQRALGFWEEPHQAERSVTKEKAALGVISPAAPAQAPSQTPPQEPTLISAAPKATIPTVHLEPSVRNSASAAEVKSISSQSLRVTSLADAPAGRSRDAVQQIPVAAQQISEIPPPTAISSKQPRALPYRAPRLEGFDSMGLQEAKDRENRGSNKRIILILTAAIVLLAIGAVGGALFLRWNRALAITQQPSTALVSTAASEPVATMPTPGLATPPAAPIANASVKSNSVAPASSSSTLQGNAGPGTSTVPQPTPARLSIETPKIEVRSEPQLQPKVEVRSEPQPPPVTRANINVARISAPNMRTAAKINALEPPPVLPSDTAALSRINENVMNTVGSAGSVASPGPPPAAVKGGQLLQPKLISSVASTYPAAAKAAHVQGDVLIDALIDSTGKVAATKVINGSPLLQQAAVDSLRFWKYEPARLNGEPIPIHIKVNVNFRLQ